MESCWADITPEQKFLINALWRVVKNREYARKSQASNQERCRANKLKWARAHPEQGPNWRLANPEKYQKTQREYSRSHSKTKRERAAEWVKANPEKAKANRKVGKARTRARKKANGGSFTAKEWQTLLKQYGYRCVCCWLTEDELKLLGRKLVPDHIISLKNGGMNIIENLQPLCHGVGGCNNKKGSKYQDFVVS
jgi:HNH endonuclease